MKLKYKLKEKIRKWLEIPSQRDIDFLRLMTRVGVDFHPSLHESWAVICLRGKRDYVNFVKMDGRTIQEIGYFLKQFEHRNITIDCLSIPKKEFLRF